MRPLYELFPLINKYFFKTVLADHHPIKLSQAIAY
jgi:hypothetical protein